MSVLSTFWRLESSTPNWAFQSNSALLAMSVSFQVSVKRDTSTYDILSTFYSATCIHVQISIQWKEKLRWPKYLTKSNTVTKYSSN